ncbi:MAG: tyrosine-type recombinase/integrase [Lachnospiraceae bacterium]|nr:tyrosine-type recombinase/integrase [Lachnospiraceae bacterium]
MKEKSPIIFGSVLSDYISGMIKEKRAAGYDYRTEEAILLRFDCYCTEHELATPAYTKEFLSSWCEQSPSEGIANHNKRVSVVRQLSLYMMSMGIHAYLPKSHLKAEIVLPHLLTDDERSRLFREIDSYIPKTADPSSHRIADEYKVLFRMIYCCGLRNSEASGIAFENVDVGQGILTIMDAKGHKDRLVYMGEELTCLCRDYRTYLCRALNMQPSWFFPGRDPAKPLPNTTVDNAFTRFWNRTPFSKTCNNKPTVHDLRFSFITDRINLWTRQGVDVEMMLPYLARFVGHKSVLEIYYYYHTTEKLFESIRSADKTSQTVIPEVDYE